MANTLIPDPTTSLASFPGAPFATSVVDAAVAALRKYAGWHIAPATAETLTVDSNGGRFLFLPSLTLGTITEIRDVTEDTPVVLTGYRKARAGMLERVDDVWPCGYSAVAVDVTHGYASCPPELLPVVAEVAQTIVQGAELTSMRIDDYAETYASRISSRFAKASGGVATYYRAPRRTR